MRANASPRQLFFYRPQMVRLPALERIGPHGSGAAGADGQAAAGGGDLSITSPRALRGELDRGPGRLPRPAVLQRARSTTRCGSWPRMCVGSCGRSTSGRRSGWRMRRRTPSSASTRPWPRQMRRHPEQRGVAAAASPRGGGVADAGAGDRPSVGPGGQRIDRAIPELLRPRPGGDRLGRGPDRRRRRRISTKPCTSWSWPILQLAELEAYDRLLDETVEWAYRDVGASRMRPTAHGDAAALAKSASTWRG